MSPFQRSSQPRYDDDTASIDTILPAYSPRSTHQRSLSPAPSYRTELSSVDSNTPLPVAPRHRSINSIFGAIFAPKTSKPHWIKAACLRGTPEDWATVLSVLVAPHHPYTPAWSQEVLDRALFNVIIFHDSHDSELESAGRNEVAKTLLAVGADPNAVNPIGPPSLATTPLIEAVSHLRNDDIINHLLRAGADPNRLSNVGSTPLIAAIKHSRRNEQYVELLIRGGADPRVCHAITGTPLHLVAQLWTNQSAQFVINLLIAAGADLNARDRHRRSPLHTSIKHHNQSGREALLDAGAPVDHQALIEAAGANLDLIWTLLKRNPLAINSRDDNGTPLLISMISCRIPCLTFERLIQEGADMRLRDLQGNTVLHAAFTPLGGSFHLAKVDAIVRYGIDRGLDVNAVNHDGQTALHVASGLEVDSTWYNLWRSSTEMMLHHGADVNARDLTCSTPLHLAVRNPAGLQVIKTLLDGGAQARHQDADGRTPLDLAMHVVKDSQIARMLLDAEVRVKS